MGAIRQLQDRVYTQNPHVMIHFVQRVCKPLRVCILGNSQTHMMQQEILDLLRTVDPRISPCVGIQNMWKFSSGFSIETRFNGGSAEKFYTFAQSLFVILMDFMDNRGFELVS